MNCKNLLSTRRAGVLCHITSLPGQQENGDLGPQAYKFVDFIAACGFSVWQVLPLGPTHPDLSPYNLLSTHAGSPKLISLDWLVDRGWLDKSKITEFEAGPDGHRQACTYSAYSNFKKYSTDSDKSSFEKFIKTHAYWLNDYAYFTVLRKKFKNNVWDTWPDYLRDRQTGYLEKLTPDERTEIEYVQFQQFVFFTQWSELKGYAINKGVVIIGDMPIFVAFDSSDVWSHQDLFSLDQDKKPITVAGVPPDYFSESGQRWGNPQYNWEQHEATGFAWWKGRVHIQSLFFDALRIDHFRGLSQYWEIPANEETAVNGKWVNAPGESLLSTLINTFPEFCLIAEDLGTITDDVIALRDQFDIPGMTVYQFAFDGSPDNPHLPDNYVPDSIAYTATHDNDTTVSWYESLPLDAKHYVNQFIDLGDEVPWPMIRAVFHSVANIAILPMQDLLAMGHGHRMNVPGVKEGNWQWQFNWQQIDSRLQSKIADLIKETNRVNETGAIHPARS